MDVKAYGLRVKQGLVRISREILAGDHPGQPMEFDTFEDENTGNPYNRAKYIYITSIDHQERGIIAGRTVSATLNHGVRCICDNTHRIATKAEISKFLNDQIERKKTTDQLDFKKKLGQNDPGLLLRQVLATPERLEREAAAVRPPVAERLEAVAAKSQK